MNNLYGLVLCGGQSSRMGRDKGLIQTTNQSWVEKSHALLESIPINDVFISINERQKANYNSKTYKYIIDNDFAKGPLNGLLTAHHFHPNKDFFVLACDMQLMTTDTLLPLLSCYKKYHLHCDAFVYKKQGEIEPLCGIYTHSTLAKVIKKARLGTLDNYSLKHLLENVNTYFLDTPQEVSFENFNTEADIIQFS